MNYDSESGFPQFTKEYADRMMLAVIIATFSFIIIASTTGMPISGTHTIVSAIFGVGMAVNAEMSYLGNHGALTIL